MTDWNDLIWSILVKLGITTIYLKIGPKVYRDITQIIKDLKSKPDDQYILKDYFEDYLKDHEDNVSDAEIDAIIKFERELEELGLEAHGSGGIKYPELEPFDQNGSHDFLYLNELGKSILDFVENVIPEITNRFVEDVQNATMIPHLKELKDLDDYQLQEFCQWYVLFGAEYTGDEDYNIYRIARKHHETINHSNNSGMYDTFAVRKVIGVALRDKLME